MRLNKQKFVLVGLVLSGACAPLASAYAMCNVVSDYDYTVLSWHAVEIALYAFIAPSFFVYLFASLFNRIIKKHGGRSPWYLRVLIIGCSWVFAVLILIGFLFVVGMSGGTSSNDVTGCYMPSP